MTLRLWPRSLVGQLVFAVAVMLFVAQAVNFVLLSRGMKQQTLAHGGGMTSSGEVLFMSIFTPKRPFVSQSQLGRK